MKHALKTPQASRLHGAMAFIISGDLLRRLMADETGVEQLGIGFAQFVGNTFQCMPRSDVTYYPVLAVFRLPAGHRFGTFDQYQLAAGTTALIYPVYRRYKSSIRAALLDQAIPACRAWLKSCQTGPRARKAESFYALYDQTFDELVFGPNKIAGASAGGRLQFAGKARVVLSNQPRVAEF